MEESSLTILKLIAVAVIIGVNAFFAVVEFSMVAVKRAVIEKHAAHGSRAAQLALRFLNNPDSLIAASQLGITMASLALGWIGEATIAELLVPILERHLGTFLGQATAHTTGVVVAFAFITYLHIVLGEQAPKSLTLRAAEKVFLLSAYPVYWFYMVFRPFIWVLDKSTALVLKPFGVPVGSELRKAYSVEELRLLIRESYEKGLLEETEETLLARVFDFGDRTVREVMIPRTEIIAIEADSTIAEFLQEFKRSRHARYPVYEDTIDNIIGFIAIKDVLLSLDGTPESFRKKVRDLIRPAYIVPESKPIDELMLEMRENRVQMAVVIDEYGGTAGLVTLEELLEEIVGRVSDESAVVRPQIQRVGDNLYLVDATLRVDELNEELELNIPESEDYETLAGFIYTYLQRVPREGEEFSFNGVVVSVTEMKGPRIVRVLLKKPGPPSSR